MNAVNPFADLESDFGPEADVVPADKAAEYFVSQVAYARNATGHRADAERARKPAPLTVCPKCHGDGVWKGYGDCMGGRA